MFERRILRSLGNSDSTEVTIRSYPSPSWLLHPIFIIIVC